MSERRMFRVRGCGNCAHYTRTSDTRGNCDHEPTPALRTATWPSVFCDDVCGYWRTKEKP